jgi:hypothetical protein
MHRTGEYSGTARYKNSRRCLSEAEMYSRGMRRANNGAWTTGRKFVKMAA